jgi:cell division protein FtsL
MKSLNEITRKFNEELERIKRDYIIKSEKTDKVFYTIIGIISISMALLILHGFIFK